MFPYDPTRKDPRWTKFQKEYKAKYNEEPEQFASLAYDAAQAMLDSICKAGLNRARIHDALADIETYHGVTSNMVFDTNSKNTTPMFLATVHNERFLIAWRQWKKSSLLRKPTWNRHQRLRRHSPMLAWAKRV